MVVERRSEALDPSDTPRAYSSPLVTGVASALAQCCFSTACFSKSAILHRFPNFYTLRVEIFRIFFHSRLHMTPMNDDKSHGNRSARFSEIRKTDTQTDRRGSFIYRCVIMQCLKKRISVAFRTRKALTRGRTDQIYGCCCY